jgi:asparagine synthase (glutamine-hydrolysing)
LAYRNALLPLLPRMSHTRLVHGQNEIPIQPWLRSDMLKRYGLAGRPSSASKYGGRLRHHYEHAVTESIANLESPHHGGLIADALEVRHPFLYRPLVEFALRLPPELRARPHAHRWVVREAMKGVLPEKVRTRVGKPGTADVLMWCLVAQRAQLVLLTRDPILGELGIVNASRLRAEFDAAASHRVAGGRLHAPLLGVLGIEAWLQIRSGRWPYKRVSANRN